MSERCEVAIVGSGFAGALLARMLVVLGYDVALIERGTHPRFAIGESSTPLANLSLERIARRYGLADCHRLATHGRWLEHYPQLRRGLKRGFTFYRHHPGLPLNAHERLLVAASPSDATSDTHWLRCDVDAHFVQRAEAAGVTYRDRAELTGAEFGDGVTLNGTRDGAPFTLHSNFVIDASGPGGFLARQLGIPSALDRVQTRSGLLFSHFAGVRPMRDVVPCCTCGPFPDDRAAMHQIVDEGWMYGLRFDHDVTSAGFLLSPAGLASLRDAGQLATPAGTWRAMLDRYPDIGNAFGPAEPLMPLAFRERIQHRLTRAAGERWLMLPHAYAFVDPLFSTGIAWSLRSAERIALMFESASRGQRAPSQTDLARYEERLSAEATQIDTLVAGAYDAMVDFDLFAAHAMIYFALVSYAEVLHRVRGGDELAWDGFLGVGDPVAGGLPLQSRRRLRRIVGATVEGNARGAGDAGRGGVSADQREEYAAWVRDAIAPRNVASLADPARGNLYPVDLDVLIESHAKLGLTRDQLTAALPALRGMAPEPVFPPAFPPT